MNRTLRLFIIFASLLGTAAQGISQDPPRRDVIYGDDDRIDLYQTKNTQLLELADSTVALFQNGRIEFDGETARLKTDSYSERYKLCREEPFYDQNMGAFCSGSLVGPDLIMTAGHCVTSASSCESTKFVFGFGIKEEGAKTPNQVPASEVYGCKELLGSHVEDRGADWALIRLDRPVAKHKPLAVNRTGSIEAKTLLFVIGHPAGLATKIAGGASVRDSAPQGYFVANLDTYGGNSGSAVFNAKTGLVEGILVRGEMDYEWRGDCRVSNRCPNDGCSGEDVTKISALTSQIPPAFRIFQTARKPNRLIPANSFKNAFKLFDAKKYKNE